MTELLFCLFMGVGIVYCSTALLQLLCLAFGVGEAKRRARREQQAREIFEKVVSGTKAKAPSGIAQVTPMFLDCMAPVIAGKEPAHAVEFETITPSGMGSYVIICLDATVFERVVQPALDKEFGA